MNRRLLLISILTLMCTALVFAQENADLADQHFAFGDSLLTQEKYDSARIFFEQAITIYKNNNLQKREAESLNKSVECYQKLGNNEQAMALANEALSLAEKNNFPSVKTNSLFLLGKIYWSGPEKTRAIDYFQQVILDPNKTDPIADSYSLIGLFHEQNGSYDLALNAYHKVLEIKLYLHGKNHKDYAKSLVDLAIANYYIGNYTRGLAFAMEALETYDGIAGTTDTDLANSYGIVAVHLKSMSKFDQALDYQHKALRVLKSSSESSPQDLGRHHGNLGGILSQLLDSTALEHFAQEKKIIEDIHGIESPVLYSLYTSLGLFYGRMGNYDQSVKYIRKALAMTKEMFGENHPFLVKAYHNLSSCYLDKKEYELAIECIQKALKIANNSYGFHHHETAAAYLTLGEIYMEMESYSEALLNIQKSLASNLIGFQGETVFDNPPIKDYLHLVYFLDAMIIKAQTLEKMYESTHKEECVSASIKVYSLCDSLLDHLHHSSNRNLDKAEIGQISTEVYSAAIRSNLNFSKKEASTDSSLNQMFYFSEKSKAAILSQHLSDLEAKQHGAVPDSIVEKESDLKTRQSFLRSKILEMRAGQTPYDSAQMDSFQDRFFSTNQKLDSLTYSLEQDYPQYFQLKYQNKTITPSEIQQKLEPNQALIEYFEGDSTFYIFTITKEDFKIDTFDKDSVFNQTIGKYLESLDPEKTQSKPQEAYEAFSQSSYTLYQKLLQPALEHLTSSVDELIIIPSDRLSCMPWDIFIRKLPDLQEMNYQSLDYLFKEYAVSYAHSATLLFQQFHGSKKKPEQAVLAFAPSYPTEIAEDSYSSVPTVFRNELVPLKWSKTEIEAIEKYFDGKYFTAADATERIFKQEADRYQVLHLAMHALVDHEEPMRSRLVFSQATDSLEDGMLYTHELFNLSLPSELAVLSACQTGLGKIQQGEGVMSLGRAFSYAGCPSIVMSHWSVDDESTSSLMSYFYGSLAEGLSKDKALQEAKKEYLKNAKVDKQHPLFWGGFVVLGDTSPLTSNDDNKIYWWVSAGMLLLLGIPIFRRKFHQ